MIEAYDWLIAFQGSEGSDQSYCNNELSPGDNKCSAARNTCRKHAELRNKLLYV